MDQVDVKIIDQVRSSVKSHLTDAKVEHLPESLIKRSLILHQFDIEKASQLITKFIKAKVDTPKLFNTPVDEIKKSFGINITSLRSRGPNGELLLLHDVRTWDVENLTVRFLCSTDIFINYALNINDENLKNGIILLFNADTTGWKHIRAIEIMTVINYIKILAFKAPINLKSFCVFNANWACEKLDLVIRPLLPKSISEKIILVSNVEKLTNILGYFDHNALVDNSTSDIEPFKTEMSNLCDETIKEWNAIDKIFD